MDKNLVREVELLRKAIIVLTGAIGEYALSTNNKSELWK
jgi:hypothetical protein